MKDYAGGSVSSAGDFNGDGFDDLIIGARGGSSFDNATPFAGESYVVFGGANVGSSGSLEATKLDGGNGFVIFGVEAFAQTGISVSGAGDFNDDGFDDLIIGSKNRNADVPVTDSFIVFGGSEVGNSGSLNLVLDGSNGFAIDGNEPQRRGEDIGTSVSGAGDINGDGVDDVIIGSSRDISLSANVEEIQNYVVFGGSEVGNSGSLELATLDGSNGFVLNGIDLDRVFFTLVSGAGDVNSDGVDDVIISARADSGGQSYVVFGTADTSVTPNPPKPPIFDLSQCTIIGTDGPDVLTGTTGPDIICGLGGNDEIRGLGGADIIFAGKGDDFVRAGGGNDLVFGENGRDTLVGGSGDDLLNGGNRGDKLFGGRGSDTLFGGRGADRLFGASGNDRLFGGRGGDALFSGPGNDFLDGGPFNNSCTANSGVNTLENC